MPSGCEFVCENIDCQCHKSGFTMHDLWPIAKIDDILDSKPVEDFPEGFEDEMRERKKSGREYGIVPYPLDSSISIVGIRVQLWGDNPPSLIDEDIVSDDVQNILDTKGEPGFVDILSDKGYSHEKESSSLRLYRECLKDGIACPHCGYKLTQKVWSVKFR